MQIYGLITWIEEKYPTHLRWPISRELIFSRAKSRESGASPSTCIDRSIDRSCFQCDKQGTALILTRDPIKPGYYNYSFTGSIIISWMNASLIMTSHARRFIDKCETSIPSSSTLERRGNDRRNRVVLARRISIRFLSTLALMWDVLPQPLALPNFFVFEGKRIRFKYFNPCTLG